MSILSSLFIMPFIDSSGTIGRSFVRSSDKNITSRNLRKGEKITFRSAGRVNYINLILPSGRAVKVTKINAISLAHWLLDNCTE